MSVFDKVSTEYYVDGDNLGIYSTPSTNTAQIRLHYTKYPDSMSSDSDTMGLDDDYKTLIVLSAAIKLLRKLIPQDPQKYVLLRNALKDDFEEEEYKLYGRHRDGEAFVKIDHNDF